MKLEYLKKSHRKTICSIKEPVKNIKALDA